MFVIVTFANRCPTERQTRPALLQGRPSAGNRFGRSKVSIARRPLVLQSGRPLDTCGNSLKVWMGNVTAV